MKPFSVCLIGNSHVAALKLAWSNHPPSLQDGFAITFFSAQNHLMTAIERKGNALISGNESLAEKLRYTSGGLDRIEVRDYDAFVLVGSGFGIDVLRLGEECGTLAPGEGEHVLSQACLSASVEAYLGKSMALKLAAMIRAVTDAPIVLVGAPFVSERLLQDEPQSTQPWLKDPAFLERFVASCRAAGERVARRAGCEIVWQAESTYTLPGFTSETFNRNPARFSMRGFRTPEFDAKHGNEDYGVLMLGKILERLDGISGGHVMATAKAKTKKRAAPRTA
jgi:hypothetical protein